MRARQIASTVSILAVLVLVTGACAENHQSTSSPTRTITANAVGTAEATPDLLTITIGVQTQGTRAAAALADNNSKTAGVIAKFKSAGVAERDIQTSQLTLYPRYGPTQVITGYEASNVVTAKLRHLDAAGRVIDDAAAVAGNDARVTGISFSIADDSSLLSEARADAVRQATARAKAMARAAGVSLGRLRSVTDVANQLPQPFSNGDARAAAGAAAAPVPLQPGSQELSVQVAVIYDIV